MGFRHLYFAAVLLLSFEIGYGRNGCKIPSSLKNKAVGIWSPQNTPLGILIGKRYCPIHYPFPVAHNGYSYCCYETYFQYNACESCNSYYGTCYTNGDIWQNQRYSYGATKNVNQGYGVDFNYDNVYDIGDLQRDDVLLVDCSSSWSSEPEIKAFRCGMGFRLKDCSDEGIPFSADSVNIFVPHLKHTHEAINYCEEMGGKLASIRQEFDDKMAAKIMRMRWWELTSAGQRHAPCTYIGFSDADREGIWTWMNGDKVTYTNWYEESRLSWDQPNDGYGYGGEDYAVICYLEGLNRFKWFDVGPPRNQNPLLYENMAYALCTIPDFSTTGYSDCEVPYIRNGYVDPDETIPHDEEYTAHCYSGFSMSGRPTITCDDGVTSEAPTCYRRTVVYGAAGSGGGSDCGDDDATPRAGGGGGSGCDNSAGDDGTPRAG